MSRVPNLDDWIVIGISGVTCSGKTSAAVSLRDALRGSTLMHQDRYFLADDDPRHIPSAVPDHHDYDVLGALDMARMYDDVCRLIEGEEVPSSDPHIPNSDDLRLRPACRKYRVRGKRLLILEGFTLLNHRPLRDLCHLRYYLDLEYSECARRRGNRTYDPPDLPDYFRLVAWPRHLQHLALLSAAAGEVRVLDAARGDFVDMVLHDLVGLGLEPDD